MSSQSGSEASPHLLISLGDPAGIGMEVVLKALADPSLPTALKPILVGCRRTLISTHQRLQRQSTIPLADPADLCIDDQPLAIDVEPGQPNIAGASAGFDWLTRSVMLLKEKQARALVTAPIAKHLWHAAGRVYPGQTERLAELAGSARSSMMFTAISPHTGWRLNTLLATTHLPLNQVSQALNPAVVEHKLSVLLAFCQRFRPTPHLVVAGLNPHAGENGRLGSEEANWLEPLLNSWRQRHPHVRLEGPISPDTCWLSAGQAWRDTNSKGPDGYLALYHDQGLIPLKLLAFDAAVNTTLELPFLRTSPDHGTGFDIAAAGIARADSMVAALQAAWDLSEIRRA